MMYVNSFMDFTLLTSNRSRSKYKGLKIEWGNDECDTPIPNPPQPQQVHKENDAPKKRKVPINRFALLNLDGTMDGSTDDENNITDVLDLASGLNGVAV